MSHDTSPENRPPASPHADPSAHDARLPDGIATLAEHAGFLIDWEDALGTQHRVPDAMLVSLLARIGLPCSTAEELANSLALLERESPARRLPPLLSANVGSPVAMTCGVIQPGMPYKITLEQGGVIEGQVHAAVPDTVGTTPRESVAAVAAAAPGSTAQTVYLDAITVAGYHTLEINAQRATLAIAPSRCFGISDALARDGRGDVDAAAEAAGATPHGTPHIPFHDAHRPWGVSAQVYGLRRDGDAGLGDFTALSRLTRVCAAAGAAAIAVSPLHAMFSADPGKFSPYSPSSRLFLNVLHIDPAAVFGTDAVDKAIQALDLADTLKALEDAPLIDWTGAAQARLSILRHLFDEHRGQRDRAIGGPFATFAAFRLAGGALLENHARFEALHAHLLAGTSTDTAADPSASLHDWRRWPEALRNPANAQVAAFAAQHRDEVDFHLFLQWLADQGLADAQRTARAAGMPIGLIADLAVGCDGAGSQTWGDPASMLQGLSVGAPPDIFNQAGQAWGLTTFSPRALVNGGFQSFIAMVRNAFAHAGGIRVDHILGLRRLWLVPEGHSAREGAYLRYPLEDMLRILALESWRYQAVVIGEDLGTVPPGLREQLAEGGLMGMRVLWFERAAANPTDADATAANTEAKADASASAADAGAASHTDKPDAGTPAPARDTFVPPARWSEDAIAMTTTHDLPTIAGWWQGGDIAWRARIGQSSGGDEGVQREQAERREDRVLLWQAMADAGIVAPSHTHAVADTAPVDAILQFVARTRAPLALYPMEDLLGLEDQPNLPGSTDEHPNWRRRLPVTIDALTSANASPGTTHAELPRCFHHRLHLIDTERRATHPGAPAHPHGAVAAPAPSEASNASNASTASTASGAAPSSDSSAHPPAHRPAH
jgi:4-alpha-glucanotransferase